MISMYTYYIIMAKTFTYKNINFYLRRRAALIKELGRVGPFINGSVVKIAHVCGNKNCRCARGEKHISTCLTFRHRHKKMTSTLYIPVNMVEEVRQWRNEYRRIKRILEEACEIQKKIIRQHVTEKRAKRRR